MSAERKTAGQAPARVLARHTWAHWALGLLDLGRGDPDTALVQLEKHLAGTGPLPRIRLAQHP